jgi:hypothetical protein
MGEKFLVCGKEHKFRATLWVSLLIIFFYMERINPLGAMPSLFLSIWEPKS